MRVEKIGDATLYLADCNDVLPLIKGGVDAVITDPPYSEVTHKNAKSNRTVGYGNKAIDFLPITAGELSKIISDCSSICSGWFVATMEWRHIAEFEQSPPCGWEFVRFGVWVKTNPMPQISADRPAQGWEGIAYLYSKKGETKKSWNGGGSHGNYVGALVSDGLHPTGKPLGLVRGFVDKFTNPLELILDPFMGSGTTGVAAIEMGRKFIGIEREASYFEIACERIERATKQIGLFDEPKQIKFEQGALL